MLPNEIVGIISGLQREVLLLRTELNFELWLKRENIQHVARLHQSRVLTKDADMERLRLVISFSFERLVRRLIPFLFQRPSGYEKTKCSYSN